MYISYGHLIIPGRGIDQKPPIGSASFQVLEVVLTSCTCTVKSQKIGCFKKTQCEKAMWRRSNLSLFVAVYGN